MSPLSAAGSAPRTLTPSRMPEKKYRAKCHLSTRVAVHPQKKIQKWWKIGDVLSNILVIYAE